MKKYRYQCHSICLISLIIPGSGNIIAASAFLSGGVLFLSGGAEQVFRRRGGVLQYQSESIPERRIYAGPGFRSLNVNMFTPQFPQPSIRIWGLVYPSHILIYDDMLSRRGTLYYAGLSRSDLPFYVRLSLNSEAPLPRITAYQV
jgi:hypothetical protein